MRHSACLSVMACQRPPSKPQAWDNEWLKAIQPFGPTAATDSETGALHRSSLLRFPLTPPARTKPLRRGEGPALSLGEREKRSPPGDGSSALDCSQWIRLLFPSPTGP